MKISLRWLARHVDLAGVEPAELARLLTLHTAEVEGIEPFAPALGQVVVGHVLSREPHPNADKLGVCRVDLGQGEPAQIVCGAANVRAGHRVAVAVPGAVLPGDFKIKVSKIRGVESAGMICSERELGLGDEHAGIWVLPADAPIGVPVTEALDASDWVVEIDNKSLTHRPDLWGHRGMAREVAALLGRELRPLETALPKTHGGGERPIPVAIDTPDCTRYLALPLELPADLEPGSLARSPDWLRLLLLAAGQRPIDLLVDLSNFVMLDLGQPNHLFDARHIDAGGIAVRQARAGERMTTLDGAERALLPADLLITSGERAVALAGVMGGEDSKVVADTRSLVLEVATFRPTPVRRTAARLDLRSESSARFEKSLDPHLVEPAAAHFARLLAELVPGAAPSGPVSVAGELPPVPAPIELDAARLAATLGAEVPGARVEDLLTRLGFDVAVTANGWRVGVPTWRATRDVSLPEDLVEEVGRMVGYASLGEARMGAELAPAPRDARRELARALADAAAGSAGLLEVETYSFLPAPLARDLALDEEPHVEVENPVAEGWQRVRRSVLPSLVGLLPLNLRHGGDLGLFEIGKGYLPESPNGRGEPAEVHELALVLASPPVAEGRHALGGALARLRGIVELLVRRAGVGAQTAWEPAPGGPPFTHPTRRASLSCGGRELAFAAELHPAAARRLELEADVAVATLNLDALLGLERPGARHVPLPRFPGRSLDVALAVPRSAPAAEAEALIRAAGKGLVRRVELFDLYRGPGLAEGQKSLAYNVLLVSEERTLEEADVRKFLERLERTSRDRGFELRGSPRS